MTDSNDEQKPHPVPVSAAARRVLGVLVEKAKTTPDNYPLTLAAIIAGSNQKSNRSPKMDLDEHDAMVALDELREVGAAIEVQGSGRAIKYRHAAYQWLDVDSPGAAVMTELLLRGPQTIGEIRTRASRMYKLPELQAAQSVIDQLIEKKLVEPVTPPGRGQVFAHTLYQPEERQHLQAKVDQQAQAAPAPSAARQVVDQLIDRLDKVNDRIESLEQRIAELEK